MATSNRISSKSIFVALLHAPFANQEISEEKPKRRRRRNHKSKVEAVVVVALQALLVLTEEVQQVQLL